MGGLREPEICAATGIEEDRVYRACKVLVQCGTCVRRAVDGELSIAPPWWAEAEQTFNAVA
jgi:ferredoxin